MSDRPDEPSQMAPSRECCRILAKLQKAERIDRKHYFQLPGDSALNIALRGLEECCDGHAGPARPELEAPQDTNE